MAVKDRLEGQFRDVEKSYRELVAEIERQLKDLEKRAAKAMDDLQEQVPDEVAQTIGRLREMNASMRKRLAAMSEQALETTRDAIDSLSESAGRVTGRGAATRSTAKKTAKKPAAAKKTAKKPAAAKMSAAKPSGRASAKWTKAELSAEASRLEITGRSSMTKAQLVRAINQANA